MKKQFLFFLLIAGNALIAQNELVLDKVRETKQMEYDFSFAEGLRFKMLGNTAEAGKFFNKCMIIHPDRPASYYEMSKLAVSTKDLLLARGYIEKARVLDENNVWYALLEVRIADMDNRNADAAQLYKNLFDRNESSYEYLVAEIDSRIKAKDYKNAIKRIKFLKKKVGYGSHIAFRLRDIYQAEGKNEKALKEVQKLVNTFPDNIEYRGMLAELMLDLGKDEPALEEFNKIKEVNPENPIVYFSLGQYYIQKGNREKAVEEFISGFKSKQVNPEIKISVLLELVKNENDKEKLSPSLTQLLDVLYESEKGNPDVDALYADNAYSLGNTEEAEAVYKRVVKAKPGNYMAWQNLLFIQNSQLDYSEMLELAKEAVKAFPNQPIFHLFRGIGASGMKDYEQAIDALKTGARLNRNNTELTKQFYISLGDAYYNINNYKEAFLNFDLLLVLEPDNELVLNNYSYYLALRNEKLAKALKMIENCLKIAPDNATYLDTYAWVLYRLKRYDEALVVITKSINYTKDSLSGTVIEHYGDILFRNGDKKEAVAQWKRAKILGETSNEIDRKILRGIIDE